MSKTLSYQKTFEKRLCLHYLFHLSKPGVFALVNEKQKKVLVLASKTPLKALMTLLSDLGNGGCTNQPLTQDRKRLQLKILEQTQYPSIMKLKWIDFYKDSGYTIYNQEVLPKYRKDMKVNIDTHQIEVAIVTAGKRWYKVAEFSDPKAATDFLETHTVYQLLELLETI